MDGHPLTPILGLGPVPAAYWGSFECNGTSDPSSTTFRYPRGLAFTVVYSATGVFTVTVPAGLTLPSQAHSIIVTPQVTALSDYFATMIVGETTLNTTTRAFVVQCHRAGTGEAPAATAGNRINFAIFATNSTGL